MVAFETGPIRPPSEATSLLLRLTRYCHWNKCGFCPVYKEDRFSIRKVDEIKRDIDAMALIADRIRRQLNIPDDAGADRAAVIEAIEKLDDDGEVDGECARQMAFWMCYGLHTVFLQDADAMVLRTDQLVDILNHLRKAFPTINRVTSYARAKTISRKSLDELKALRAAGLNRIHTGMESGSDVLLSLFKKGVTREEQIRAGRNVVAAGIELSEYFMPGLGGREMSEIHAVESAAVLNAVNPTFIRLRSTIPVPGTPLHRMMTEGQWTPLTEEEKVREIKTFIERLEGITSTVRSDHIMNLLEDVEGKLPDDKPRILEPMERFLGMSPLDKELFIVGRRMNRFRQVSDFSPARDVERVRRELIERFGSVDQGILKVLVNFI